MNNITFGLTGGICCGKSTVTKTILSHGIPVVDADIVARQIVEIGSPGLKEIINNFGTSFLNDDSSLNRIKFGKYVFEAKEALSLLNHIMGPLLIAEATIQINKFHEAGHKLVCLDAALIIEMGIADNYRPLIVVHCPESMQLARLIRRNSLTEGEARARIKAQIPGTEKLKFADFVIDSSKELEFSRNQTEDIIKIIKDLSNPVR